MFRYFSQEKNYVSKLYVMTITHSGEAMLQIPDQPLHFRTLLSHAFNKIIQHVQLHSNNCSQKQKYGFSQF